LAAADLVGDDETPEGGEVRARAVADAEFGSGDPVAGFELVVLVKAEALLGDADDDAGIGVGAGGGEEREGGEACGGEGAETAVERRHGEDVLGGVMACGREAGKGVKGMTEERARVWEVA
jgi:hypothetical protein